MMKIWLVLVVVGLVAAMAAAKFAKRPAEKTVDSVVGNLQAKVQRRFAARVGELGLQWPLKHLAFVGLKQEKQLEVWASADAKAWKLLHTYPVLAASGGAGPKLREGDKQVPEGIYSINAFNPRSQFHLSLRVSYPNADDSAHAAQENRKQLGGDIYIHGSNVSIGCLALGDEAIEEVFTIAALSSRKIPVLLAPRDFRKLKPTAADSRGQPKWMEKRYRELAEKLIAEFSPGS